MGNEDRMGPVDQLWKPTKTRNIEVDILPLFSWKKCLGQWKHLVCVTNKCSLCKQIDQV